MQQRHNLYVVKTKKHGARAERARRGFFSPRKRNYYFFYSVPEAREAFKNDPEARGSVFPEYEPVASHGDPKSARNPER